MFTDSTITEAVWFLMSSKTAEPNTISLPWNICCIVTKFVRTRNKHKTKKKHTVTRDVLASDTFLWGPNATAQKSPPDNRRSAKSLPPPGVDPVPQTSKAPPLELS